MKFIIDTMPYYCPQCGIKLMNAEPSFLAFDRGECFRCFCGAGYQRVPVGKIIELAAVFGDAREEWEND